MITSDDLRRVNDALDKIPFKNKGYVMVNKRVQAFRDLCPNGTIKTDIIKFEGDFVYMRAEVWDGDTLLATGTAFENKNASYINKTSYIENCETSAVGRALGFLGIGNDDSMASAEELANALLQQEALKKPISEKEQKILVRMVEKRGLDLKEALNGMELSKVTGEVYQDAIKRLEKLPEVK